MKSRELLKFSERQSLVEITKANRIEYCVCSYYNDNAPEGSKWDWGHYFYTLESALKYIVLECFDYKDEIEKEKIVSEQSLITQFVFGRKRIYILMMKKNGKNVCAQNLI